MDYASLHGPGISNFSSPSPHRLPTVSAATALANAKGSSTRCVSTGLPDLDAGLQNAVPGQTSYGGVSRGKVTEVYGPPGVGKTAFGMQVAASALYFSGNVVWVDASHPVPGPRFSQIISSFKPNPNENPSSSPLQPPSDPIANLTHFTTPTLAHLLALLCHQTPTHPPQNTSLIVIDSLSTLLSNAFPRYADPNTPKQPKKPGPNPSARKIPILQSLLTSLQTLALTRNIAVLVLSQCGTRMRPDAGAALVPTIAIPAWELGLGCRIILLRDFGWNDNEGNPVHDVRLAQVTKAEGINIEPAKRRLVGFSVTQTGLTQLTLPISPTPNMPISPVKFSIPTLQRPLKRKLDATDLEIPDSEGEEDEDYGWVEEDEGNIPAMPPQWQGSEDILIPAPGDLEAEDPEIDPGEDVGGEEIGDSEDELAL